MLWLSDFIFYGTMIAGALIIVVIGALMIYITTADIWKGR